MGSTSLFEKCRPAAEFLGECAYYRRHPSGAPIHFLLWGPELRRGAAAHVLQAGDVVSAHLGEETRSISVGTLLAAESAYSAFIARYDISETGEKQVRPKWITR